MGKKFYKKQKLRKKKEDLKLLDRRIKKTFDLDQLMDNSNKKSKLETIYDRLICDLILLLL